MPYIKLSEIAEVREDVFSLDKGSIFIRWPGLVIGATGEDIDHWMKLVSNKIKQSISEKQQGNDNPESEKSAPPTCDQ